MAKEVTTYEYNGSNTVRKITLRCHPEYRELLVTRFLVECWGAKGGSHNDIDYPSYSNEGESGDYVQGILELVEDTDIYFWIGEVGGYRGGGWYGSSGSYYRAGGSTGLSLVGTNGSSTPNTSNAIIIAKGGKGANYHWVEFEPNLQEKSMSNASSDMCDTSKIKGSSGSGWIKVNKFNSSKYTQYQLSSKVGTIKGWWKVYLGGSISSGTYTFKIRKADGSVTAMCAYVAWGSQKFKQIDEQSTENGELELSWHTPGEKTAFYVLIQTEGEVSFEMTINHPSDGFHHFNKTNTCLHKHKVLISFEDVHHEAAGGTCSCGNSYNNRYIKNFSATPLVNPSYGKIKITRLDPDYRVNNIKNDDYRNLLVNRPVSDKEYADDVFNKYYRDVRLKRFIKQLTYKCVIETEYTSDNFEPLEWFLETEGATECIIPYDNEMIYTQPGTYEYIVPGDGVYLFECWGAAGGSDTNMCGHGAYARGICYINSDITTIYAVVGGKGSMTTIENEHAIGGYNGGSDACRPNDNDVNVGSGGGASDIRIGGNTLNDRIIVAGGGAGKGYSTNNLYGHGGVSTDEGIEYRYTSSDENDLRITNTYGTGSNFGYSDSYNKLTYIGFDIVESVLKDYISQGTNNIFNNTNLLTYCGPWITSLLSKYLVNCPTCNGTGLSLTEYEDEEYVAETYNYSYTGNVQSQTFAPGKYRLEVWGAQGGNYSKYLGGKGGYSIGTITITEETTLYICVGGQGMSGEYIATSTGGYNGGGTSYYYGKGGGGATHIATRTGVLSSLSSYRNSVLIVAGGGGGAQASTGGAGGGLTGEAGQGRCGTPGQGGTQTTGGTGGRYTGSFGKGGNGSSGGDGNYGGAGGGGWYGGGGASSDSSVVDDSGGGGGSGYIGGVQEASTTSGIRSGDGYARISRLDVRTKYQPCETCKGTKQHYDPEQTDSIYDDIIEYAAPNNEYETKLATIDSSMVSKFPIYVKGPGGGGGWYGGTAKRENKNYTEATGGTSYVYTESSSSAYSGVKPNTNFYMSNVQNVSGYTSQPEIHENDIHGSTGDGVIRIRRLSIAPPKIKVTHSVEEIRES